MNNRYPLLGSHVLSGNLLHQSLVENAHSFVWITGIRCLLKRRACKRCLVVVLFIVLKSWGSACLLMAANAGISVTVKC